MAGVTRSNISSLHSGVIVHGSEHRLGKELDAIRVITETSVVFNVKILNFSLIRLLEGNEISIVRG